jgi:hypothetical protein
VKATWNAAAALALTLVAPLRFITARFHKFLMGVFGDLEPFLFSRKHLQFALDISSAVAESQAAKGAFVMLPALSTSQRDMIDRLADFLQVSATSEMYGADRRVKLVVNRRIEEPRLLLSDLVPRVCCLTSGHFPKSSKGAQSVISETAEFQSIPPAALSVDETAFRPQEECEDDDFQSAAVAEGMEKYAATRRSSDARRTAVDFGEVPSGRAVHPSWHFRMSSTCVSFSPRSIDKLSLKFEDGSDQPLAVVEFVSSSPTSVSILTGNPLTPVSAATLPNFPSTLWVLYRRGAIAVGVGIRRLDNVVLFGGEEGGPAAAYVAFEGGKGASIRSIYVAPPLPESLPCVGHVLVANLRGAQKAEEVAGQLGAVLFRKGPNPETYFMIFDSVKSADEAIDKFDGGEVHVTRYDEDVMVPKNTRVRPRVDRGAFANLIKRSLRYF